MLAAEEEEREMNNYDRFIAVREKLRLVHEAGYAVDRLRTKGSFSGPVEAFQPDCMTEEKRKLQAWEADADKDERRAVRVLLSDYYDLKSELADLLAAS